MQLKRYIIFFMWIVPLGVFSQTSWKDSLLHAKKAYEKGNYTQAFNQTMAAQRLAPESIDLAKDLGTTAYRAGDFAQAEKAFNHAISREPNEKLKAKKWHNLGNTQVQQQRYKEAVESYKNALRLNPSAEETRYNLAEVLRKMKQAEDEEKEKDSSEQDQSESGEDQQENGKNDDSDEQEGAPEDSSGENKEQNESQEGDTSEEETFDASQRIVDKRMEKMLDELLEKEMKAKEKMQKREAVKRKGTSSSGKEW